MKKAMKSGFMNKKALMEEYGVSDENKQSEMPSIISNQDKQIEEKATEVQCPVYADAVRQMKKTAKIRHDYIDKEIKDAKGKDTLSENIVIERDNKTYLNESLFETYDGINSIILTIDEDGEVSDYSYIDQYESEAHLEELSNMSYEDLKAKGIVGFAQIDGTSVVTREACPEHEEIVNKAIEEYVKNLEPEYDYDGMDESIERLFSSDVVSAVEDGFLDWEAVGRAALNCMSEDDIKDMAKSNNWELFPNDDE